MESITPRVPQKVKRMVEKAHRHDQELDREPVAIERYFRHNQYLLEHIGPGPALVGPRHIDHDQDGDDKIHDAEYKPPTNDDGNGDENGSKDDSGTPAQPGSQAMTKAELTVWLKSLEPMIVSKHSSLAV